MTHSRTIKKYLHHKFEGVEVDLIAQAYKCFLSLPDEGKDLLIKMMTEAIKSEEERGLRSRPYEVALIGPAVELNPEFAKLMAMKAEGYTNKSIKAFKPSGRRKLKG